MITYSPFSNIFFIMPNQTGFYNDHPIFEEVPTPSCETTWVYDSKYPARISKIMGGKGERGPKIIETLNALLARELTVSSQHVVHAEMCDNGRAACIIKFNNIGCQSSILGKMKKKWCSIE
jgi:hypothetical protein